MTVERTIVLLLASLFLHASSVGMQAKDLMFSALSFNSSAMMPNDSRMQSVSNMVLEHNADFVFLTECYTNGLERSLMEPSGHYGYCASARSHIDITERFYSKYPIVDVTEVGPGVDDDVWVHRVRVVPQAGDTLSVYCCHLPHGSNRRCAEVEAMLSDAGKYRGHIVVMGDMNSLPLSRPMRMFRNSGMLNAWEEMGRGSGYTFRLYGFPIRIDHMFYSPDMQLKSVRVIRTSLSDHNALVGEFEI